MSKENLNIWNEVQATDPKYTKAYSNDGGGTSINAVYMVKKATEVFGPLGKGWGYTVLEERYDQGGPLEVLESGTVYAQTHTLKLELWYIVDGNRCTITHFGHTPYVSKNRYGVATDTEAPKKSLTDAIKKCLSMLGFSSDIFMGEFDDQDYLAKRSQEAEIERAENKVDAQAKQELEYKENLAKSLELIKTAVSLNELEGIYKSTVRKAKIRNDDQAILDLEKAKNRKKTELNKKEAKAK